MQTFAHISRHKSNYGLQIGFRCQLEGEVSNGMHFRKFFQLLFELKLTESECKDKILTDEFFLNSNHLFKTIQINFYETLMRVDENIDGSGHRKPIWSLLLIFFVGIEQSIWPLSLEYIYGSQIAHLVNIKVENFSGQFLSQLAILCFYVKVHVS